MWGGGRGAGTAFGACCIDRYGDSGQCRARGQLARCPLSSLNKLELWRVRASGCGYEQRYRWTISGKRVHCGLNVVNKSLLRVSAGRNAPLVPPNIVDMFTNWMYGLTSVTLTASAIIVRSRSVRMNYFRYDMQCTMPCWLATN